MQIMSYFDIHITFTVKVKFMLGSEDTVCCRVTQEEKSICLCRNCKVLGLFDTPGERNNV